MQPTREQIELAAYDRWLRRDRAHGHDRADWVGCENELIYALNYETVVEYRLDSTSPLLLGAAQPRRCRFCERTGRYTSFSAPRAVVNGNEPMSLFSSQVCDECEEECRVPLDVHVANFWRVQTRGGERDSILALDVDLLAVFKSLVTSALLVMPEAELAYFDDTVEWVNNPDLGCDAGMFAGSECYLYRAPFLHDQSWVRLARRVDDQSPFPYMLSFLCSNGLIIQIAVPLSLCDHDLDGRNSRMPVRSLTAGAGGTFCETHASFLRMVERPVRRRHDRRPELTFA